jgi:hypothetical protein
VTDERHAIREWRDVDAATFRNDIVPLYRPAVLRGLVGHWPAVQRARQSIPSIGQYLRGFDKGGSVDVIMMPPHVRGRMFYSDDMRGFIPTLWWHHVESLARYNVLINYWWKGDVKANGGGDTALNCLLLCLLALKRLPPEHRRVWRSIFDHYVFDADPASVEHIPEHVRGVLGEISPDLSRQLKAFLVSQLQR